MLSLPSLVLTCIIIMFFESKELELDDDVVSTLELGELEQLGSSSWVLGMVLAHILIYVW